jgi:hypothetical protein
MASGRPKHGNKLLVMPVHEHSQQEFLQHLEVKSMLAGVLSTSASLGILRYWKDLELRV